MATPDGICNRVISTREPQNRLQAGNTVSQTQVLCPQSKSKPTNCLAKEKTYSLYSVPVRAVILYDPNLALFPQRLVRRQKRKNILNNLTATSPQLKSHTMAQIRTQINAQIQCTQRLIHVSPSQFQGSCRITQDPGPTNVFAQCPPML